jgi:hypothetical protein
MKGPVFLAMWNPLSLLLTLLCSSLLGETVHLGRYIPVATINFSGVNSNFFEKLVSIVIISRSFK